MAHSSSHSSDPGTSKVRNENGKPRCNRKKRRHEGNGSDTDEVTINAGFSSQLTGQRKKPFKGKSDGLSTLDKILDKPCQIHSTSDKPANHSNQNCWVIKQAGKIAGESQGKGQPGSKDDDEPPRPSNGGQK